MGARVAGLWLPLGGVGDRLWRPGGHRNGARFRDCCRWALLRARNSGRGASAEEGPVQKWGLVWRAGGICSPLGGVGDRLWPPGGGHRKRARDWRGAEQPRRRAACGQAAGPERGSAEPRKARFFAQQKMRPNEVLPVSYVFFYFLQADRG
jgi:hypothetical protein